VHEINLSSKEEALRVVTRFLQGAKEETDRIYRQEALDYFRWLKAYVEREGDQIAKKPKQKQFEGFVLTPRDLKTERTYPDLYIVLAPSEVRAGLGNASGHKVLVLPVLVASYDTKYLATRMLGASKAFIHEFIHYLDSQRYKDKGQGSAVALREQGFDAYYNTPAEFNAYYQEGVNEILGTLEIIRDHAEAKKPGTLAEFLKSFSVFEKKFLSYFSEDFIKALNPTYQRKFIQRFYGFYNKVRDEFIST